MRGNRVLVQRPHERIAGLVSRISRGRGNRRAQGALRQKPCEDESDATHHRREQKHRIQGGCESLLVRRARRRWKAEYCLHAHAVGAVGQRGGWKRTSEICAQSRCEHRPKNRRAERAANQSKQRRTRSGNPEIGVVDGVLHRDHQHLHHHAEADTKYQHQQRCRRFAGLRTKARQQKQPGGHDGCSQNRKDFVVTGAADQLSGRDRRHQHPAHHRDHLHPRAGRTHRLHYLKK